MKFIDEINKLSEKYLNEAGLDYGHKKKGEINFTKTDGTEDYIQHIIEEYANFKKINKTEAEEIFNNHVVDMQTSMEKSTKINGTMLQNAAESAAFNMLEEIQIEGVKFEKRVFQNLFNYVKAEVPEFYPLSNVFETKRIEPTLAFTPDPLTPEYASVNTAACTPTAVLIFNVPFMEKLIKFASIKGLKANPHKLHGKKYESQGGDIPDTYQYAEFVLLHEIMHYANGDFYFEKAFDLDGSIVNYVGDFITNYNLVKSGYAQIPIGLFNDEINYDRYNTYQEMYDVVEAELKKLSNQEQQNMKNQMDKMGDNMPEKGQGQDPNQKQNGQSKPQNGQDQQQQQGQQQQGQPQDGQGQGQPQDGQGQGQPQDGQGQGQPQDGQGQGKPQDSQGQGKPQDSQGQGGNSDKKDGEQSDKKDGDGTGKDDDQTDKKDGKSGKGSKDKEAEERAKQQKDAEAANKTSGVNTQDGKEKKQIPKSVDDAMKGNGEMLNNGQSDVGRETKNAGAKDASNAGAIADMMSGANNGTGINSADGNPYAMAEREYKPKLNWKQIIKKFVPSGTVKNETYSKPSRRTTSSMVSIAQTGSGVVKPGMKDEESDKKGLCFVLDNSGSTMGKIGEMQNDIMNLMKKNAKQLNGIMYVIKFSNDVHYFKVDIKKKKYARITEIDSFIQTGKSDVKCDQPVASLFKSTYGGGTELTTKVTNAIKTLKSKMNFNTIMFSDTDIAYGENAKTLKQIYKIMGPNSFALIGCDNGDYKAFVDLLGDKKNITHL